jgi:Holliday junction DNA helicase RuvA
MSRLSLPLLENAIRIGDVGTLAKCPGIGKKTAERLVVELKSKVGAGHSGAPAATEGGAAGAPEGGPHRDAVAALIALGYKAVDADQAVRHAALALGPQASTEALIKKALS